MYVTFFVFKVYCPWFNLSHLASGLRVLYGTLQYVTYLFHAPYIGGKNDGIFYSLLYALAFF